MSIANCRTCGAPIIWAKTEKGNAVPLDARPCADGNIVLQDRLAHYVKAGEPVPAGQDRYQSHFATCPDAKAHRKKRA
jgi:hypothetical protein